jgi:hypothetical protein
MSRSTGRRLRYDGEVYTEHLGSAMKPVVVGAVAVGGVGSYPETMAWKHFRLIEQPQPKEFCGMQPRSPGRHISPFGDVTITQPLTIRLEERSIDADFMLTDFRLLHAPEPTTPRPLTPTRTTRDVVSN